MLWGQNGTKQKMDEGAAFVGDVEQLAYAAWDGAEFGTW